MVEYMKVDLINFKNIKKPATACISTMVNNGKADTIKQ